jgi:hypothetical protein
MRLYVLGIMFFAIVAAVLASSPIPHPLCNITGTILSVQHQAEYTNPCVSEGSCPTDVPRGSPAQYAVVVALQHVSYSRGDSPERCDMLVSNQTFYVPDTLYADALPLNVTITGEVDSFWKSFSSYHTDIQPTQFLDTNLSFGVIAGIMLFLVITTLLLAKRLRKK